MKTNYSILITGDLVLSKEYPISNIDDNIVSLFKNSDLNIVNLEAPITNSKKKIDKTGPNIKSHEQSTKDVLDKLNIDIVTLANNHILDYDEQGVSDTLSFCKTNNIKTVGAGMNLEEASKILYIDTIEGKIAIVNFAENEWTSATEQTAGSNPMDLIDNFKQLQQAKQNADFVITIIHGGNEYSHYPSPRMVKQYRFYAESGADAVIGHHTHCVSGYEEHKGVPIFYSLGNFLFTTAKRKPDSWYSGLVLNLKIKKGSKIYFEVIPVSQSKEGQILSIMEGKDKEEVLDLMKKVNKVISDEELLKAEWMNFVSKVESGYIRRLTPIAGFNNRFVNAALYRTGIYKWFLNRTYLKETLNRVRCEAHSDVMRTVFEKLVRK